MSSQSRKTIIQQEAASYEESTTSKFRQIQLHKIAIPPTATTPIQGLVKTPSGASDRALIIENHDGTINLRYDPKQEGLHEVNLVTAANESVPGSPLKIHVDSLEEKSCTAYGPGLSHGVAGEPCNFTITTKNAGPGGLQVAVEGTSKADIVCHDNKDGTVSVSYLPDTPGEYRIIVRFAEKDIKGSPFSARIIGEGRKRMQISFGASSEVALKISETDLKSLNATIVTPGGTEEPCIIKKMPNGTIGISFSPRVAGQHFVNVKRANKHIQGSPFMINVLEREIGDSTKVRVKGSALKEGRTHIDNEFMVDTKDAGYGGLSLSIEGPSKADIQCKDNEDGTLKVSYKPTEPGYYIANLKFADQHVPGSPFTIKVSGTGSIQRELVHKQRDALPVTDVGCECKLTFKMKGILTFNAICRLTNSFQPFRNEYTRHVSQGDISVRNY